MLRVLSEITTLKSFLQLSNGRCMAHIYLGTVFSNSALKPISLQFAFVLYERIQYKIPGRKQESEIQGHTLFQAKYVISHSHS